MDGGWFLILKKMLYDNAMLLRAFAGMYAITKETMYRRAAAHTAQYLMRDMQSSEGGYYSAEDADSEGEEGKFYVWDEDELAGFLTPDEIERLRRRWNLSTKGNFEGKTILNRIGSEDEPDEEDNKLLSKLYGIRNKRIPPFKDKKISASWNGLAIEGMALAGMALGDIALVESAEKAARFVMTHMSDMDGIFCGTYLNGPGGPAFLADWANMANGLLTLFTATRKPKWLEKARALATGLLSRFTDERGFLMSPGDGEALLTIPRDTYDGAMPSGSSCAVTALQRLYQLTGEEEWGAALQKAVDALLPMAESSPASHVHLLTTLLAGYQPHRQVIILAPPESTAASDAYQMLCSRFEPFTTVIWHHGDEVMEKTLPMLKGYRTDRSLAAYVCENHTCKAPVFTKEELLKVLNTH